jgi:hypothetical protein
MAIRLYGEAAAQLLFLLRCWLIVNFTQIKLKTNNNILIPFLSSVRYIGNNYRTKLVESLVTIFLGKSSIP